ncbi:hypothetical protein L218DRAFT_950391 [Marasmius fiardii PR-910]|nr:hypothetical protein L218DRAFT_950391 [Marasmius fiardii PR-910]
MYLLFYQEIKSCKVDDYHRFSIVGKGGVGEVGAGYRDEVASLQKGYGGKSEISLTNSFPLMAYISTSNSLTSTAEEAENDEDGQDGVVTISPSLKLALTTLAEIGRISNLKDVSLEDEWSELMFTVDVETPMMEPSSSVVSSSPEIDFGRHQRGSSFYNLPNDPICISPSASAVSVTRRFWVLLSLFNDDLFFSRLGPSFSSIKNWYSYSYLRLLLSKMNSPLRPSSRICPTPHFHLFRFSLGIRQSPVGIGSLSNFGRTREEDVVDVALGEGDRSSVYWVLKSAWVVSLPERISSSFSPICLNLLYKHIAKPGKAKQTKNKQETLDELFFISHYLPPFLC